MSEVAGVQQKRRRHLERPDLLDAGVTRAGHVGGPRAVESDMAGGDLDKAQLAFKLLFRALADLAHGERFEHSTLQHKVSSGACPSHALQKSATVDSIASAIIINEIRHVSSSVDAGLSPS